jgi:hypothetical protein
MIDNESFMQQRVNIHRRIDKRNLALNWIHFNEISLKRQLRAAIIAIQRMIAEIEMIKFRITSRYGIVESIKTHSRKLLSVSGWISPKSKS